MNRGTVGLWSMVGCAACLDYVTTRIGLSVGLVESNSLAAAGIEAVGLGAAVLLLKSPALILAAVAHRRQLGGDLAPLALVVLWTGASLFNIISIAQEVVA